MTAADAIAARGGWSARGFSAPLAFRFALREMRGGLRGFYVFLACIVLGTGTIAGVNSLARGLVDGITAEGQSLNGGDASFELVHRQASPEERAFLETTGRVSANATLRAMARPPGGRQTLVELKGVDGAYPLYGEVVLASGRPVQEALQPVDGAVPAVVDEALLVTADLAVGERFQLGKSTVEVMDVIEREPDRLAGGIAFGPRVIIPSDALEATGLVGLGSLVEWRYNVAGADGPMSDVALARLVERAEAEFPLAGWKAETRADAAPGLRRSIDRFAQFLTLVGLTALAVGGVGVANAVRSYLQRKRGTIATLRSLGAPPRFITTLYLAQIAILATLGVAMGLVLGAVAPPVAGYFLANLLPVSGLFQLFPLSLALAAVFGFLTALTFALWPLGSAQGVRPVALFRDDLSDAPSSSRRPFAVATAVAAALLAGVAVATSYDPWLAAAFVGGAIAVFVLLRLVASLIMAVAARLPRSRATVVRLAVANMHRRGALTPTVTLSLGLSLTLLVTLALVDGNLRSALTSRLPAEAPSFFFVDIQEGERERFLSFVGEVAPEGELTSQPMLRGRITQINDVRSEDWPDTEASWVLRGDRGITYSAAPPENGRVVEGTWWTADGGGKNQVSFDVDLARELGVKIGDVVRVNVLGREVSATITNLRTVEWESLSINFVMVFSPNVFAGAPHAHLATLALPDEAVDRELTILNRVVDAFPTVTSVRVKDALETVNSVVEDLALAIRAAATVTLVTAVLVLAGTLAASHRSRIYDAVILKTLGARRRTVILAYALEYALLGLSAALFGILAGVVAGWAITVFLMELPFAFFATAALSAVALALVVTVGLGLVGTWRALGETPAAVLRDL